MSHPSKVKGTRIERETVNALRELGIDAKRVPLSGAHPDLPGDITINLVNVLLTGEIKARKNGNGFAVIESWLGERDFLVLRRNHAEPLIVISWKTFCDFLKGKNENKESNKG